MWGLSSLCPSRLTCHVSLSSPCPGRLTAGTTQWVPSLPLDLDNEKRQQETGGTEEGEWAQSTICLVPSLWGCLSVSQRSLLHAHGGRWLSLRDALLPCFGNHFLYALLGLWVVKASLLLTAGYCATPFILPHPTPVLWRVPLWINLLSLYVIAFSCWDPDKLVHGYNRLHSISPFLKR